MGKACGTYGGQENCMESFGWGDLREIENLKDPQRRNKGNRESKTVRRGKAKNKSQ